MMKLNPIHTRKGQSDADTRIIEAGGVAAVLARPNEAMPMASFIEKVVWQLYTDFNAFIVPTYEELAWPDGRRERRYTGLWPIAPTGVEFLQDAEGKLHVRLAFRTGIDAVLPYSDVIHIRYRFGRNDYLGGDSWGRPDNKALAEMLEIERKMLDGISRAMEASSQFIGAYKYNTMLANDAMIKGINEFMEALKENRSALLPLDLKGEYIPFRRDVKLVDAETLKFIDQRILRLFGVSVPMLNGDYTKEQFEAFSQKVLEPLIVSFNQAFTNALFTPGELAHGNRVVFYQNELVMLSVKDKLALLEQLGPSGTMTENEKRVMFGLPPLPELVGKRMQSLNYVDAYLANEYQTGQAEEGSE